MSDDPNTTQERAMEGPSENQAARQLEGNQEEAQRQPKEEQADREEAKGEEEAPQVAAALPIPDSPFLTELARLLRGSLRPYLNTEPDEVIEAARQDHQLDQEVANENLLQYICRTLVESNDMGKLAEIRELFARTPEDPAFNTPAGIDDSAMNQFYELIRDCRVVPEDDQTFVPRQALATRIHLIIDSFQARRESEFLRQWCQQNIVCLLYGNPVPEMKDFAYRILIEMLTSSSTWTAELESFANELSRKRGTFINDYWATIRDQNEAGDLDPKRTLFADFRDQHSVFGNVQFDIFRERLAQLEKLWHSQMRMFDVPDKVLCVTGIVTDTMTEMLMGVKDGVEAQYHTVPEKARIFYRLSDGAETSEAPAEASARASEAPEAPALPPKRSRGIKRKLSEYAEELFESKKPKSDELPTAEQWMYFLQHCLQGPEQDEQRGGNQ